MVAATSSRSKESEQRADPLTRTQRVDTTDLQIKNKEFIRELKDLKKLRSFVRRTSAAAASDTSLDALNLLQSSSRGR
jgi:hypothetical protein